MPMVYYVSSAHTEVGLWLAEEPAHFFEEALLQAAYPLDALDAISHPEKKRQWLASRYLLTTLYPAAIQEYKDRKPTLRNGPQVSISHSANMVGVALGNKYTGLDLQLPDEKLYRIAPRFVCEGELALLQRRDELEALTVLWTIKEAVFKHFGTGMPFRQIVLESHDPSTGQSLVGAEKNGKRFRLNLNSHMVEGVAVSFLCD